MFHGPRLAPGCVISTTLGNFTCMWSSYFCSAKRTPSRSTSVKHLSMQRARHQCATYRPIARASAKAAITLVYSARVSLDKTRMQVDENIVDLTPGVAATVEISIGSRTVMSYLLSPLLKYAHDGLREK